LVRGYEGVAAGAIENHHTSTLLSHEPGQLLIGWVVCDELDMTWFAVKVDSVALLYLFASEVLKDHGQSRAKLGKNEFVVRMHTQRCE
jgi:hypothetical protein